MNKTMKLLVNCRINWKSKLKNNWEIIVKLHFGQLVILSTSCWCRTYNKHVHYVCTTNGCQRKFYLIGGRQQYTSCVAVLKVSNPFIFLVDWQKLNLQLIRWSIDSLRVFLSKNAPKSCWFKLLKCLNLEKNDWNWSPFSFYIMTEWKPPTKLCNTVSVFLLKLFI